MIHAPIKKAIAIQNPKVIIGKPRQGRSRNVSLEFEAMFTKFKDTQNS